MSCDRAAISCSHDVRQREGKCASRGSSRTRHNAGVPRRCIRSVSSAANLDFAQVDRFPNTSAAGRKLDHHRRQHRQPAVLLARTRSPRGTSPNSKRPGTRTSTGQAWRASIRLRGRRSSTTASCTSSPETTTSLPWMRRTVRTSGRTTRASIRASTRSAAAGMRVASRSAKEWCSSRSSTACSSRSTS